MEPDFCDGGCGNELTSVKNMVQVEDGICFLCQKCFRVFKQQLMSDESKELYLNGFLMRGRKNGKGINRFRQQASTA